MTVDSLDQYPLLNQARLFSESTIVALQNAFRGLADDVSTIAICGSVKRLEAHTGSDLDLIVVVDDRDQQLSESRQLQIQNFVWKAIARTPALAAFNRPKQGGLFSTCASWRNLTDCTRRGVVDEDIATFGHRLHLLMDAIPVAGADCFEALQRDLLAWYSETQVTQAFGGDSHFEWLTQDVLRYWYSLRARSYWMFREEPQKSSTVNIKLRSSRFLQVAAFLLRIQQAGKHECSTQLDVLKNSRTRSPLSTICSQLPPTEQRTLLSAWQFIWNALKSRDEADREAKILRTHLDDIRTQVRAAGIWLP